MLSRECGRFTKRSVLTTLGKEAKYALTTCAITSPQFCNGR
jgi:hypothetical protein